ncbi:uncharacterized protein LOC134228513 [Saccostrea cucullata]|uniref:uncharacterized protein LOC134228513 n=1 Tax=Saccostrea cuccullata TaxID=36930 RepID=UPI002ED3767A
MAFIIAGAALAAGIPLLYKLGKRLMRDKDKDDGDTDEDYDFEESRKVINVLQEDIQNIKETILSEKEKIENHQKSIRKTQLDINVKAESLKVLEKEEKFASERTLDYLKDLNNAKGNNDNEELMELKCENAKKEEEIIKKRKKLASMNQEMKQMETGIEKQEREIKEKEDRIKKKELEIKIKMKEENSMLSEPFIPLPGESKRLDEKVKNYFLHEIQGLEALPEECKFVNILLVGPTGAGKSSFVNTSATALEQKGRLIHVANTRTSAAESATKKLSPEILKIKGDSNLTVRMFDCRGLSLADQETIGKNEMELIIEGHIKQYSSITDGGSMTETEDVYIKNPKIKDEMHCIVYVVNASRDEEFLNDDIKKEIKGLLDKQTPTNKPQFILLTNMDKVVPKKDVENLFRYRCVRRACNNASKITQITPGYILPTANYTQPGPTNVMDALCLLNLFRIVSSAHDYVNRRIIEEKEKNLSLP